MDSKILVLGDGLLGSEIVNQTGWDYISRKKDGFDITKPNIFASYFIESHHGISFTNKYDIIINCIANTNTYSLDAKSHWDVNYKGTCDLIDFCNKWNIKLVHISTDHVYTNSVPRATEETVPIHGNNWYGYTKLLADAYMQLRSQNYLLIRESHKPYPFPYKEAWINQYTNGDYVNVIADLIIKLIKTEAIGVYNVGTEEKTWYDLTTTEFNTLPTTKPHNAPSNITMDLTKLKIWLLKN